MSPRKNRECEERRIWRAEEGGEGRVALKTKRRTANVRTLSALATIPPPLSFFSAGFTPTTIIGGAVTLTSSKGLCKVATDTGLLTCAAANTAGSEFLIVSARSSLPSLISPEPILIHLCCLAGRGRHHLARR